MAVAKGLNYDCDIDVIAVALCTCCLSDNHSSLSVTSHFLLQMNLFRNFQMGFQEEEAIAMKATFCLQLSSSGSCWALCSCSDSEPTSCFPQVPTDNGLMQKMMYVCVCMYMHLHNYSIWETGDMTPGPNKYFGGLFLSFPSLSFICGHAIVVWEQTLGSDSWGRTGLCLFSWLQRDIVSSASQRETGLVKRVVTTVLSLGHRCRMLCVWSAWQHALAVHQLLLLVCSMVFHVLWTKTVGIRRCMYLFHTPFSPAYWL